MYHRHNNEHKADEFDNFRKLTCIQLKQNGTQTGTLRHVTFQAELVGEYVIDQHLLRSPRKI